MTCNTWTESYIALAEFWANQRSKDPSTKVGAVIVNPHNHVVSLGYNGFPKGVEDSEERLNDRDTKIRFVQHAERNALDNSDVPVRGCTMYVTLKPCSECAKSIVQKGITEVVYRKPNRPDTFGWDLTDIIFQEAGIKIQELN